MHRGGHAFLHSCSRGSWRERLRARRLVGVLSASLVSLAVSACGGHDGNAASSSGSLLSSANAASSNVVNSNVIPTAVAAPAKGGATTTSATTGSVTSTDWVDTLVNDMKLFHDGPVRTLQWIPQWGTGRNYPETYPKPQGWQIGQPWGVIMADTNDSAGSGSPWRVPGPYTGNRAPNTRAQVRDLQLWWLMSNGQWVLGGHDPKPAGEMYQASWAGDAYTAENAFRDETGNGGGVSARYINMNAPGTSSYQFDQYLWHFYGSRASVPSGYVGFAIAYFARKILHDPSGPDDRANARLLADTAGDWWTTADARWDNFKTNGPMGYNRFKYLTNDWQMISFHTLTEAQIRANPPPIAGR